MPSVEQFRVLVRSYRWNTAVGADHWQPRVLGLLPDYLIQSLLDLAKFMLLSGRMPHQIALLIVVLIPKSEGGQRPIGIFPTVLRLVDRWFRWQYGADWLSKQEVGGGFYGCKGRTVEDAVWRQALLGEWSAAVGRCSASYLLDIRKAFEHIRHSDLWDVARRRGFSLTMLAWLLNTFTMARRLQVLGGLSQEVRATRSVVPGSSFADILMRLAVVEVVDATRVRWPLISLAVVVDDVQATVYGEPDFVERVSRESCNFIVGRLNQQGLPISEPKVQLVGTDGNVLKRIAGRCKPCGEP